MDSPRGSAVHEKGVYNVNNGSVNEENEGVISNESLSDQHHGTYHDVRDMGRLGKKQEFMVSCR